MIWVRRATVLGFALIVTAIVFRFWGNLIGAMGDFFDEKPAVRVPPSGEVTMTIIPPPAPRPVNKPACDKTHPCP